MLLYLMHSTRFHAWFDLPKCCLFEVAAVDDYFPFFEDAPADGSMYMSHMMDLLQDAFNKDDAEAMETQDWKFQVFFITIKI